MLNFYITAVKYGILQIGSVPSVYQEKVRGELGLTVGKEEVIEPEEVIEKPIEETPAE